LTSRTGPISALIGLVIEIDRQHRRIAADAELAAIGLIDFEDLLVDDVLPAMVLEIAGHDGLLWRFYSWRTLRPKS
jgi:hypothetical protein